MVEKLAQDYSKYFHNCNVEKEINPLCLSIEETLTRLDEFETLLTNVKIETNSTMENHVVPLLAFQQNFQTLCERIDNLEKFVDVVNENVNSVERSIDIAEEELGVTDYSLKGLLFKPLFSRSKNIDGESRTNLKDDEFQKVEIFKTSQYFPTSEEPTSD
ncbi:biogenesis of lysosome-related organelles complex 1 subunit 4 [Episyrphus balteatus]|uniref:biogenesis of lysosome-related organelles complex 1 subunit 4 n=1 Tax=Episyrphus balteatus TaxID=286459 RepID=UPI0024855170|nr:biogenesis of lysosome-related organelles complex 1 subunit 4 [Episyrphus balteatus]